MRTFVLAIILAGLCFLVGWSVSRYMRTAGLAGGPAAACDLVLAGSNTIGERLAPAAVRAFFEAQGFTVEDQATDSVEEARLTAVKDGQTCAIEIQSHGSGHAFEALASGVAQIGMSSRAIRSGEIDELREAGAGDFLAEAESAEHVIGFDGIAIITHPSRTLSELSRVQVKQIFLGQIRDWRELGQAAGPIRLYARDDASGTFQFFQEHVLESDPAWESVAGQARRYASSSELTTGVSNDPNAIGFVGAAYISEAVRALDISNGGPAFSPSDANVRSESYPISRRLFLYVRPETMRNVPSVAELVAFFKSEAAYPIVEDLHYVSLRAAPQAPSRAVAARVEDNCNPDAPETQVYRRATAGGQKLSSVIRFRPRSNVMDSLARDDVARVMPLLQQELERGSGVWLIGHTDSDGDAMVNRRIAMDRAEAARAALEQRGLIGLQVESAGEQCPIAANADEAGRQANRRVEIWVVGN